MKINENEDTSDDNIRDIKNVDCPEVLNKETTGTIFFSLH